MRRLFVVLCALLVYGSFYPWQFRWTNGISLQQALLRVFQSWPAEYSTGILQDISLNLVVYIPLGLIGYLAAGRYTRGAFQWTRLGSPILSGFLLSLFVETIQSYVPSRVPSALDLVCNTAGAAIGVVIGVLYEAVISRVLTRAEIHLKMRPSSALMMLIVFAAQMSMPTVLRGYEWFLHTYSGPDIVDLITRESRNAFAFAMATWLFAARFLEVMVSSYAKASLKLHWLKTLACLAMIAAAIYLIRITNPLTDTEWKGAAAGALLYALTTLICPGAVRDWLLAIAALAWLVGDGLRPYWFVGRNHFEWIPFLGMLGANWLGSVTSLITKTWMYGSAFWIWERAGISPSVCAAILLLVLAAIEYAQLSLPGRISTMTDLAMGAISIGLLWGVERKYSKA